MNEQDLKMLHKKKLLTPLEAKWIQLHDKYGLLPFQQMNCLVEYVVLLLKFKVLKNKHFLYASCIFGKMKKRLWRTKGPHGKKMIKKESENHPGAKV